jgi:hypothetical protein
MVMSKQRGFSLHVVTAIRLQQVAPVASSLGEVFILFPSQQGPWPFSIGGFSDVPTV